MGLLDFAQGASNAAAQQVTVPVDMMAWALKKLGLPIPDNYMGGSQWAEEMGLMRKVPNMYGKTGEAVGLLMPVMAARRGLL